MQFKLPRIDFDWNKIIHDKRYTIPLGILAGAIIIFLLLWITKPSAGFNHFEDKTWPVSVMKLEPGNFTPYVTLYGRIESPETSDIESVVEADVAKVPVREGDTVKKGELLVELVDSKIKLYLAEKQAAVNDLQAQLQIEDRKHKMDLEALKNEQELLTLAQRQVDRQEQLKKTNAVSELALDKAKEEMQRRSLNVTVRNESIAQHEHRQLQLEAKLQSAKAQRDEVQMDLDDTKIYAPFDGKITKVYVAPGERVQPGETVLQLFNKTDVEIRAQIPDPYIAKAKQLVREKQKRTATVFIDGDKYTVYLDRLAGEVGSGRAGIDGLFKVTNDSEGLSVGRIIQFKLLLAQAQDVYAVPDTAIFNGDRVYKIEDNVLQSVRIERVGQAQLKDGNEGILIKSDILQPGDEIITTPLPNAITGLRVERLKQTGLGSQNETQTH